MEICDLNQEIRSMMNKSLADARISGELPIHEYLKKMKDHFESPVFVLASAIRKLNPQVFQVVFGHEEASMFSGQFREPSDLEVLSSAADCIFRMMQEKADLEERLAIALAARPALEEKKERRRL